jgi:hypothetical protein
VGAPGAGFCAACLTGIYPVPIPAEAGKGVLEVEVDISERSDVSIDYLDDQPGMLPSDEAAARQPREGSGGG